MIFPLSIDSPHLSQCQDPTIDPAPVHTPAHTAPLLTHLCLFVVSLCYVWFVQKSWQTMRHIRLHTASEFIPPRDDSTQTRGAPRCGVLLLLLLISPQDTHDEFELCLDSSLTFTRRTRDIESAQCDVSESRTRRCWVPFVNSSDEIFPCYNTSLQRVSIALPRPTINFN